MAAAKGKPAKKPAKPYVRVSAHEIALRNASMVSMKLVNSGATWADIGAAHGVSEKTARRAYEEFGKQNRADVAAITKDNLGYVANKIAEWAALREELTVLAHGAELESTRVGAIKGILELHVREIDLLQKSGLLPHDLGTIRYQMNVNLMTEAVYDVIKVYVPAKDKKAANEHLLEALEGKLPQRQLTS